MSAITDLKKTRVAASAPVKPGQWHAGFSTVKAYAGNNAVPLFGVWVENTCGKSNAFCQCLLSAQFKAWQKTCGVALWCGFHSDSGEDGFEGKGFKWTRKNVLKDYPFVRLYWKKGGIDVCMSGADWGASGAAIVKKLKGYLKNYDPAPAPVPALATDIIALPCTAAALETALHGVCDAAGSWDGTVKYSGGKLVLEAAK
jgi:hypothetical protein